MRLYPGVAMLSHGLLLQLAQPCRSLQANRRRARIVRMWYVKLEQYPFSEVGIPLAFAGFAMTMALFSTRFTKNLFNASLARRGRALSSRIPPRRSGTAPVHFGLSDRPPTPQFIRYFHDEFKAPIRRELAKFGQTLDETQLQQVVDALPANVGSWHGPMPLITLMGLWTDKDYDRYVTRLVPRSSLTLSLRWTRRSSGKWPGTAFRNQRVGPTARARGEGKYVSSRGGESGHEFTRRPPDASSWPKDPFHLLGVTGWECRPAIMRRAYLHLVRSYKPEHSPLEFRLIREAYETALRLSQLFDVECTSEVGPVPATEPEPADDAHSRENDDRNLLEADTHVRLPDFWERACRCEPEAAYRGLAELVDSGRVREEIFLQLYWLLVTIPELDPDQTPGEWIVRGLRGCGRSGWKLRELVRRSPEIDPAAILDDSWTALLAPGTDVEVVLEVARCRWRAARGLKQWSVITSDVEALRAWALDTDGRLWARLLIAAAGNLIWSRAGPEHANRFPLGQARRTPDSTTRVPLSTCPSSSTPRRSPRAWTNSGCDPRPCRRSSNCFPSRGTTRGPSIGHACGPTSDRSHSRQRHRWRTSTPFANVLPPSSAA